MLRAKYYINELCRLIDVNRNGYYGWLNRKETKTRQVEYKRMIKAKIKIYHEMHPTKGYRNIQRALKNIDNITVSHYMMHLSRERRHVSNFNESLVEIFTLLGFFNAYIISVKKVLCKHRIYNHLCTTN